MSALAISSRKSGQGFFRRNLFILLAFVVPCVIMCTVFAVCKFAPFGNRMILIVDSWHQYYPFLLQYQQLLKSGGSLFYSWNIGGGANFIGVIGYYLASPLYLLTYFLPSTGSVLQIFLSASVAVKLGCSGLFFAIFLKKTFNKNDASVLFFSLMYALCSFVLGYYWNMMWLDTVALLPLVIAGVLSVLRESKFSLYIISLAVAIVANFYIGYMVCLFVLIFCICYAVAWFRSFRDIFRKLVKMAVFTVVALMLTAFLTVPVFMCLQRASTSGSGFPLEYSLNIGLGAASNGFVDSIKAFGGIVTNLVAYNAPIVYDKGNPNINCSVLGLVLSVFYFTSGKIKLREKLVSGGLLLFFFLSFMLNWLDFIWHGMNYPAMIYYRFSFMFSFVLIVLAYRAYLLMESFSKKTIIISASVLAVYLGAACFTQKPTSVAITAAAAALIIGGIAVYRSGKMNKRVLSLLLCLLVIADLGLSALVAVRTKGAPSNKDYPKSASQVQQLLSAAKDDSEENELYRTEFISNQSINDPALNSYFGISSFNSMMNSDYSDFLTEFGLAASKSNNRCVYLDGSPVTNLFLGIKYLLARDNEATVNTDYTKEISSADEVTLYKNTAYAGMGFMADESLLEYKLHDSYCLPLDTQNQLFRFATGTEKDVYETVNADSLDYTCDKELVTPLEDSKIRYNCKFSGLDENQILSFSYTIPEDGTYCGIFRSTNGDIPEVILNSDTEHPTKLDQSFAYISCLGHYSRGDKLTVNITAEANKDSRITSCLARLNKDVFEQGVNKLSRNQMKVTSRSNNEVCAEVSAEDSSLLYTSLLYDPGWSVYVDGEKAELLSVGKTFSAVRLTKGEHTLRFVFTPEGFYPGLAVSCVGVAAFAGLAVVSVCRKRKAKAKKPADNNPV